MLWRRFGEEGKSERNLAAADQGLAVIKEAPSAGQPHPGSSSESVAKVPANRDLRARKHLRALLGSEGHALHLCDQPAKIRPAALRFGRAKPIHVRDVGLDQRVLGIERMQTREQRTEQRGVTAIPIDLDTGTEPRGQPTRDVISEDRRESRARDAGDIRLLEGCQVAGDSPGEGSEQAVRQAQNLRIRRISAEKQKRLVETD